MPRSLTAAVGLVWSLLLGLVPLEAFASGFAIYDQGVAAMATGGAMVARAGDPSAVYFNPAGIVGLAGVQVMGGATAILLRNGYFISDASGLRYDQVHNTTYPAYFYVTQRIGERWGWGAGVTFPSGIRTEWDAGFPGRFISREASLTVVNVNVNGAAALGRGWSVAAGIDYVRADVDPLSRNIDLSPLGFPGVEAMTRLTGHGASVGWNAAVRWAGASGWRWGGSFRSAVTPHVKGDVAFQEIPGALQPLFPDGPAEAELPLPATIATGIGYVSASGWEGEFDIVWTGWSAFKQLAIDIQDTTSFMGTPVVADVVQDEDWKNSLAFRGGAVRHLAPRHALRFGAYLDLTPVRADHLRPRLPDANRWSMQVGYGYGGPRGVFADVAYQAILVEKRHAVGSLTDRANPVLPGEYGNFISRFGAGAGWRF